MAPITNIERERRTELLAVGLKECTSCREQLPVEQFKPNARGWMGMRSRCPDCDNAAKAAFQKRTPERQAARQRRWREVNPDASRCFGKRYRDSHPLEERLRRGRIRAARAGRRARGIDPDRCVYTGDPLRDGWAIDHAYPLGMSGSPGHVVTNLVPTNMSANSSKGRRHWLDYLADRAEAAV